MYNKNKEAVTVMTIKEVCRKFDISADTLIIRLIKLGVPVCVGVLVYAFLVVLLKVDAAKPVVDVIKRKVFKRA